MRPTSSREFFRNQSPQQSVSTPSTPSRSTTGSGIDWKNVLIAALALVVGWKVVLPLVPTNIIPIPSILVSEPAPFPNSKPTVLIVYESSEVSKYPIDIQAAIGGNDLEPRAKELGFQWRALDKDTQPAPNKSPPKEFIAGLSLWNDKLSNESGKSLPWLFIANGPRGCSEPLKDVTTTLQRIEHFK